MLVPKSKEAHSKEGKVPPRLTTVRVTDILSGVLGCSLRGHTSRAHVSKREFAPDTDNRGCPRIPWGSAGSNENFALPVFLPPHTHTGPRHRPGFAAPLRDPAARGQPGALFLIVCLDRLAKPERDIGNG